MASPRLAVLAAAVIVSGVLGGSPQLAAAPSPSPSSAPSPSSSPTASPTPSDSPTPASALSQLTAKVQKALRGNTASHVHYKISVAGLGDISAHPNRASAPASNEKLFTSIALVDKLGPAYRYATQVWGTVQPVNGVLNGDLVLVGSGDPTLTRQDLGSLAKELHTTGLRRVTGHLVIDDTRYAHGTRAPGWHHDFLPGESGAVDAFSVNNDNWRSDSAFLANPTNANASLWREALRRHSIHVAGSMLVAARPISSILLAEHMSRPLSKIVKVTLRESINYYAEMMLREVGYQYSSHGSRKSGIAAIRSYADGLGLPVGKVKDGSGLSYANRETPGTYIAWLSKLPSQPQTYGTVYDGLAVSCKADGTLHYRMCGPRLKHKVHAKTGTLTHITSLSGYTETSGKRFVVFSFLFSGVRSITTANNHIDAALAAVVRSHA
ncbi:MAG TPA: D-alanyl-D-alanine carboxypeptidase [Mycobacteriales bacterium]|nr:D-alanyl-D-alanine carboxypeptidase [Mycobacteriales bacterium]